MRARMIYLALGCAMFLAGCVSPEEQRAMDQQKCLGFGFKPETVAFANCMMSTSQQRDAQQAADQRAFQDRMAQDAQIRAAAAAASAAASNNNQNADPSPPRNAKCTSTSVTNGDTTTTHEECHW